MREDIGTAKIYDNIVYTSPIGKLTLAADETGLRGLWLEGQKWFGHPLDGRIQESSCEGNAHLAEAANWLDAYFAGKAPEPSELSLAPIGTTFQQLVWTRLLRISYGETATYGQISSDISEQLGKEHMSARAVGSAVGKNPISIIIPCHRVVGANGKLTGYAGGIERKEFLLALERENKTR